MANQTAFSKAISTLSNFDKDEFSAKSLTREICWTLARSLDETNQYSIPSSIRNAVSELKDMIEAGEADSLKAERKMEFIQNMEDKKSLYAAALDEFKVAHGDLIGSEFKYSPMKKGNDEERRDKGETKKQMDALLKKYA